MKATRLARLLGLLLAFTLIAAACGDDSDDGAEGGDETATDSTESADGGSADGGAPGDVAACQAGNINISGSSTVEPISRRAAELYEEVCADAIITVDGPGTGDGFKLFCDGETDGIAVMTSQANEAVECLAFADLYSLLGGQSEGFDNWSDADAIAAELGSTVAPFPDAP